MVKQFCEKNSFAIAIKLYRLFFCAVNLITDSRHMGWRNCKMEAIILWSGILSPPCCSVPPPTQVDTVGGSCASNANITCSLLNVLSSNDKVSCLLFIIVNKDLFGQVFMIHIAKDCLLTLVKSRLALGSPGCRSFVRHHAKNGPIQRKMVIDCPLVITSKVKHFFRPDKTRN